MKNLRQNIIISLQHHTRCKLKWKWSLLFVIQRKKCNNYTIPYLLPYAVALLLIIERKKCNRKRKKCAVREAKVVRLRTRTVWFFLPRFKKVTDLYKTKFDISTSLSLIPEVHQSLKFKWSVSVMSPVNCWYIYQYILRKAICSEELVEKRCQ